MTPDWYAHPAITVARLRALIPHLRGVTEEVIKATDPQLGDNPLTLGVMRYGRSVRRFVNAQGMVDGLVVKVENNECLIRFEDSPPIKFCYDDPTQLRPTRAVPSLRELRETPTFFDIDTNFAAVPLSTAHAVLRLFIGGEDELSIGLFAPDGGRLLQILTVTAESVVTETIGALGAGLAQAVEFEAVEPDVRTPDAAASDEQETV